MNALAKIEKVIGLFLKMNEDTLMPHIDIFIRVAENEGITMPDLIKKTGIKQSSLSRHIKFLSNYHEVDPASGTTLEKGMGLLRVEPDKLNRKRFAVFLTEKGKKVLGEIDEAMK